MKLKETKSKSEIMYVLVGNHTTEALQFRIYCKV